MQIFKIVTARNTSFSLGDPYDTSLDSPKLIEISWSLEDSWYVSYENGVRVGIHDIVEFWKKYE